MNLEVELDRLRRKRVSLEPVSFCTSDMKSSGCVWMTVGEYVWMMMGGRYCTCGRGNEGFRIRWESLLTFRLLVRVFISAFLRIPKGKLLLLLPTIVDESA